MSIHGDRANPYTLWVAAYDLLRESLPNPDADPLARLV
jgi:hypothetical protein